MRVCDTTALTLVYDKRSRRPSWREGANNALHLHPCASQSLQKVTGAKDVERCLLTDTTEISISSTPRAWTRGTGNFHALSANDPLRSGTDFGSTSFTFTRSTDLTWWALGRGWLPHTYLPSHPLLKPLSTLEGLLGASQDCGRGGAHVLGWMHRADGGPGGKSGLCYLNMWATKSATEDMVWVLGDLFHGHVGIW
jgi:hypothetical protein